MYNDTTTLAGNLKLTPKSLTGNGLMDMRVAYITSNFYLFKGISCYSDTADFELKSLGKEDKFTFVYASNVKSNRRFQPAKREMFHFKYETWVLSNFPKINIRLPRLFHLENGCKELEEMGSKKKFVV